MLKSLFPSLSSLVAGVLVAAAGRLRPVGRAERNLPIRANFEQHKAEQHRADRRRMNKLMGARQARRLRQTSTTFDNWMEEWLLSPHPEQVRLAYRVMRQWRKTDNQLVARHDENVRRYWRAQMANLRDEIARGNV